MEAKTSEFLESVQRIVSGQTVTMDEFLHHFALQNNDVRTGPPIGANFPEPGLPDHNGHVRSLESLSGPQGLLIVFVRSVNWCGYCRNQLAEINLAFEQLAARGVGVAAVTPEPVDLAVEFAAFAGLRYPILCDVGAAYIERLGILNTNLPPEAEFQNGGRVPFPGHCLLDVSGSILDKHFAADLRHRPSATKLVARTLGGATGPSVAIETDELSVRIALSSGHVQTGMEIGVEVTVEIAAGHHVYASPQPGAYLPFGISFPHAPAGGMSLDLPPPEFHELAAVGERLPVYEGRFSASGSVWLGWSPPVHGSRRINGSQDVLAAMQTAPGEHILRGVLSYQACTSSDCKMPRHVAFELPIVVEPDIDKVRAYFKGE